MTLSRFLSSYIFRSVYNRDIAWRNYYVATMVTFLVSGFWHGAGWTFVVWGIVNGMLVCIASWMKRANMSLPAWVAYPLTVLGVVLCRVLFVSGSFTDAWNVYRGMVNFSSLGTSLREAADSIWYFVSWHRSTGLRLVIGTAICWFLPNSKHMGETFRPTWKNMLFAAVLMVLCLINMNKVVQFLYFQF